MTNTHNTETDTITEDITHGTSSQTMNTVDLKIGGTRIIDPLSSEENTPSMIYLNSLTDDQIGMIVTFVKLWRDELDEKIQSREETKSSQTSSDRPVFTGDDCLLSDLVEKFPKLEDISWRHQIYTQMEFFDEVGKQTSYGQRTQDRIDRFIRKLYPCWGLKVDVLS